jgi:hypothetical protein
MGLLSGKPKIRLDEFCRDFYQRNILQAKIAGIDAALVFVDTLREMVADADASFILVESELFAHEITALRFEVFALAWLHQLGDKLVAAQTTFTKQYLEEEDRLDIWESMQPYNQAIAKASHHGVTSDTATGRARLLFLNRFRLDLFGKWHEQGFEPECVARGVNRLLSEVPWKDGVTRGYLMLTLCDRLGVEVNEEAQFQLIASIIGLYNGSREAIADVRITS